MIRFGDYLKSKVIHEAASQKYKIMMKRPVTFFDGYKNIKLQKPTKLSSSATKMELFEVQDAMIMSNQRLQYEKKLDVDFLDMMSELVGGGEAELISELKRQIDTITLNLKYSYNRLRPRETAKFYGKNLVPHVAVDTPSYHNHMLDTSWQGPLKSILNMKRIVEDSRGQCILSMLGVPLIAMLMQAKNLQIAHG